MKIEYEVCDRCKKEINRHSGYLARVKTYKAKFTFIIGGYLSEHTKELCTDCARELDEFLYPKQVSDK